MRKGGVIRPRLFGAASSEGEDEKLTKYHAELAGERRRRLGTAGAVLLVLAALLWALSAAWVRDGEEGWAAAPAGGAGGVMRGGAAQGLDDEDGEFEQVAARSGAASPEADDEGEGDGEGDEGDESAATTAGGRKQQQLLLKQGAARLRPQQQRMRDDEDDEGGEGEGEDGAEEDDEAVSAGGDEEADAADPAQHRSGGVAAQLAALHAEQSSGGALKFHKEEKSKFPADKPRMTIESYFLNLAKKSVNISPRGSYKYVLVQAKDLHGDGAFVVQGCSSKNLACKHWEAARLARSSLTSHGIDSQVVGGGRITRHHLRKSTKAGLISVFGYSRSFPKCPDCNKRACEFIAAAYPDYVVRWSNQGYLEFDEYSITDFQKCSS
jgi:hypothetical protein